MHEAKLCLALLRVAEAHRVRAGARRVTSLRLEVGAFSGVSPDALARAFPICAAGTAADGATLRLDAAPGRELRLADMEVI
ncbi:MAG: hydrogenase maturation nickel metallochaperone HypA [Deltaproteobacteria bacterium]|nr:hydrogenase maturation nickel metallochaperone HypA [Deltaproteobacteria bacterium]